MNYGDAKGVTASYVRDCPLGGVARLFPVACRLARLPSLFLCFLVASSRARWVAVYVTVESFVDIGYISWY